MPRFQKKPYRRRTSKPAVKTIHKVVNEMSKKALVKTAKIFRVSNISSTTASTILQSVVVGLAQGDNDNNRNGNKIKALKLELKGEWALPSTNTVADMSDSVRIIVFIDNQANGAMATQASILEATPSDQTIAFYNEDNIPDDNPKRFRILWDKTTTLEASGLGWNGGAVITGTVRRKWHKTITLNRMIQYNSTLGAITELNTSNIGYMILSGQNIMSVQVSHRLHFVDGGVGL